MDENTAESALGEIDPRAPIFIMSYAHGRRAEGDTSKEPDRHVLRLFEDLVEYTSMLIARPIGEEYGFIDRYMYGGEFWQSQLASAVGRCQVFIALTSAPYFQSEWCGREWDAFSRRTITKRRETSKVSSAIVPVIWAPDLSGRRLPEVDKVQRFSPGFHNYETLYQEHGIFGLLVMGHEEAYKHISWRLANWIAETFYTFRVEPLVLGVEDLYDAFRAEVR